MLKVFTRSLRRFALRLSPTVIDRYILRQFFSVLMLCLFAAVSLFLVFELFERMRVFVENQSTLWQAVEYLGLKIPLIIQLMTPVSVLVAVLISIGRLSQLSEITAMRACGASVFSLVRPLLIAGFVVSVLMFVMGETLVPWATQRVEEIYHLDIKKKDIKGRFSKANFWYRDKNKFYSIGFYNSRTSTLEGISLFKIDDHFRLQKRIVASSASWGGSPLIGWSMKDVAEAVPSGKSDFSVTTFRELPLVIKEKPRDFYNLERSPETLSYTELRQYIAKLSGDGVPVTRYLVDLAAKVSFPLVNLIVVLVAFSFALIPARSGNMSLSFVAGVSTGFGYYVVHAISTSLGSAELLPVTLSAWSANILLGTIGGYLIARAEYR